MEITEHIINSKYDFIQGYYFNDKIGRAHV